MLGALGGAAGRGLARGGPGLLRGRTRALAAEGAGAQPGPGAAPAQQRTFDRAAKAAHRARAAALRDAQPGGGVDPLQREVAGRLLERLDDCKRAFPAALVLGGAGEAVMPELVTRPIERIIYVDMAERALNRAAELHRDALAGLAAGGAVRQELIRVQLDEEQLAEGLQEVLQPGSLDLIVAPLSLHWVNDLPGCMAQCRRLLKPDGLFLAALFGGGGGGGGGGTLEELRIACAVAEMEREGGMSARVSPLVRVSDAGNLLGGAGFALPVVDTDSITVAYEDAIQAVAHLRRMGETNANVTRRKHLPRDMALAAAVAYHSLFEDPDDRVLSGSYEIIYMSGWRPDPSQQQAKDRGTATASLKDLSAALGDAPDGDPPTDP